MRKNTLQSAVVSIMASKKYSSSEKVLYFLLSVQEHKAGVYFCSLSSLAEQSGINWRTVKAAVEKLAAEKIIEIVGRVDGRNAGFAYIFHGVAGLCIMLSNSATIERTKKAISKGRYDKISDTLNLIEVPPGVMLND